ncbi:MAG: nuclear transport factor 2 family protein [Luteibaculaceae bacterium]
MEKRIFFFLFSLLFTYTTYGQKSVEQEAVKIAQAQLDAYNSLDLEGFLAVFHEDAQIFNLGNCEPIAEGKDKMREIYGNLFKNSPNLHSNVVNRSVVGNKVFDYEIITGRANSTEPYYLMAIYEVEGDKIKRCYFVRQ